MHPWSTPTAPALIEAPWRPVAIPSPPGSTPMIRTRRAPTNGWKSPIAFDPPPTHATRTSGSRRSTRRLWRRASCPITAWRSRTITGYGCGPSAEPRAEEVVGRLHVGHPVAQRLVDRVLQRLAARLDGDDACAEQAHAKDVERLA